MALNFRNLCTLYTKEGGLSSLYSLLSRDRQQEPRSRTRVRIAKQHSVTQTNHGLLAETLLGPLFLVKKTQGPLRYTMVNMQNIVYAGPLPVYYQFTKAVIFFLSDLFGSPISSAVVLTGWRSTQATFPLFPIAMLNKVGCRQGWDCKHLRSCVPLSAYEWKIYACCLTLTFVICRRKCCISASLCCSSTSLSCSPLQLLSAFLHKNKKKVLFNFTIDFLCNRRQALKRVQNKKS